MHESERQLRNAVWIRVWASYELNSDRVGRQLYVLDKMGDVALLLGGEQGEGFVTFAMALKGLGCVLRQRTFHAQRAQRVFLVRRAVAEVKVQRNFFCDSAADRL